MPFLSLMLGISVLLFALTLPAIAAAPEGPWWVRNTCLCYPSTGNPYFGHWHHCQDEEQTDFNCAEEDLNKSTYCQDDVTEERCSNNEPPGIPIEG